MAQCRWHITFGTYAARLHGGSKPTVDRRHNRLGEDQIIDDNEREQMERSALTGAPVVLSGVQRAFVEQSVPGICSRGGWTFISCAAAPNHVHVVLEADDRVHGKRIRPLLKRWLSQALNERWSAARGSWWAEGGSTRAVRGGEYREAAVSYVTKQRITPLAPERGRSQE